MSKLEASKEKNLDLLRNVGVENMALKIQINNLQNESLEIDGLGYTGSLAQRLLDEKEKEIQVLKRTKKEVENPFHPAHSYR